MSNYRNIEDLSLDQIDEDFLRDACIDMGMELEVDTRQGSIYRDAAEGHIIRTAKFFEDLRQVAEIINLETCTGEVLDQKLKERGLARNPPEPTPAQYYCLFEGEDPEIGDECTCEECEFVVTQVTPRVIITSVDTGTEMNDIPQGSPVIPDVDVDGLISCTLQELAVAAEDEEDDDSARERLINRVSGPDENANASQMRTWCESVNGVGRARIVPLWDGPMTVKAILISTAGRAATATIVDEVQEFIDPDVSGMGEGAASIGQFVTVEAASEVTIDVSASIAKSASATYSGIKTALEAALTIYFKEIALATTYSADTKVRINRVGAIISGLSGVEDYENLLLNEDNENISFTVDQIPVLGEVTVNGDI